MEELGDKCKIIFVGLLKDHLENGMVEGVQHRKVRHMPNAMPNDVS